MLIFHLRPFFLMTNDQTFDGHTGLEHLDECICFEREEMF